jgi:hypothetical protein
MKARTLLSLAPILACALFIFCGCSAECDDPLPPSTDLVISSLSPATGPLAGGGTVWIFGENFDPVGGTTTVEFGTTMALGVTVHTTGAISCTLPSAAAAGGADVTVTNPDSEVAMLTGGFQYGADNALDSSGIPLQEMDSWGSCFPSDMGFAMDSSMGRTLFVNVESEVDAVNGAAVRAINLNLAPVGPDTLYTTFALAKTDLLQADGSTSVLSGDTWGAWSSEAHTDDLFVVHKNLAFLTVSASSEADTPYMANLVVFDPETGALLQPVVNLAVSYTHPVPGQLRSDGTAIAGDTWVQTNPSGLAYVVDAGTTGRLYVSMSNLYSSATYPYASTYNPGTVQVFSVDTSLATVLTDPAATVLALSKWNPTSLSLYHSATAAKDFVLVTESGANGFYGSTGFGGSNPPYLYSSHTDAAVEIIDPATDTLLSWDPDGTGPAGYRTTIDLGLAAPAFNDIVFTTDAGGRVVGFLGSSFYGRIYAIEITGLDAAPVNGMQIRPLRNAYNPILVFSNKGVTHDYASSVAVSPNGRYAFVTDFNVGKVHVVELPSDLANGIYTVNPPYFETPFTITAADSGLARLGKIMFRTGTHTGPEAFVLVSNIELDFPADNQNYGAVATIECQGRVK